MSSNMNIFILALQVVTCARYHVDSHVVKMITEAAQLLCTACHLKGGTGHYRVTHKNHPCSLWVRESLSNWRYLRSLAKALNDEFKYRYNHKENHKSWDVIESLQEPPELEDKGLTPFAQAMPEEYRVPGDAVKAYRQYYIGAKVHLAKWTKRKVPRCFREMREKYELTIEPKLAKRKRDASVKVTKRAKKTDSSS